LNFEKQALEPQNKLRRTKMDTMRKFLAMFALTVLSGSFLSAQDWVHTGTNLGVERIRIAVADFKQTTGDPQTGALKQTFDKTLYSDLDNAGIFDLVSKSFNPRATPGSPQEIQLAQWGGDPTNAAMVAFGAIGVQGGRVTVSGWLFDAKNVGAPQVLGKQYNEAASTDNARMIAHKFADEIIFRLGGGINGIAETKIYYVCSTGGSKQIFVMDYDGQNQRQLTKVAGVALSPHVSPDNSRVAFTLLGSHGWSLDMYSLDLNRMVAFQNPGGTSISPSWSADGRTLLFSSSRSGDPEIYSSDPSGGNVHRLTQYKGPDVSPVFNPKTDAQIAWISGRTSLPQLYIMDADGSNVQRMTDGGYATSPSWQPSGGFITFAWNRKYGPGDPGGQDIYIMDVASKRWIQLTHEQGRNDFPTWSPDGRHIAFESQRGGSTSIWSMLADGTHATQLTHGQSCSMPNWSWK
jgi:TolB protein